MVKPYIAFNGNCKSALEFYQAAFGSGAPVTLTYGDYIDGKTVPETGDVVVLGTDFAEYLRFCVTGGNV